MDTLQISRKKINQVVNILTVEESFPLIDSMAHIMNLPNRHTLTTQNIENTKMSK